MVVVDEEMDTRPICDPRPRLRASEGENGYCLALFGQPGCATLPRLSRGHNSHVRKQMNNPSEFAILFFGSLGHRSYTPKLQDDKRSCSIPRKVFLDRRPTHASITTES